MRVHCYQRLSPATVLVVTFTAFIAALACSADGSVSPAYDLDSLVYSSTDIIRGHILRTRDVEKAVVCDIEVETVFFGAVPPQSTMQVKGTESYYKPVQFSGKNTRLEAGDDLFLFLVREARQPDEKAFYPIASGVKRGVSLRGWRFRPAT